MPKPQPGESHQDYISRCIPIVLNDGSADSPEQAAAICQSMWEDQSNQMAQYSLRSAVGVHHTATSTGSWDAPTNESRVKSHGSPAYYSDIYAWRDPEGSQTKSGWRFIHHEISANGTPGPANLIGCSSAIGVLNGGRGVNVGAQPWSKDREGIYRHLAAHIRDANREPPELRSNEDNIAYSSLEVRSIEEDRRIIEGIASAPIVDDFGTLIELSGMEFKLPMPLLLQHEQKSPIGDVIVARRTDDNKLWIRAQIAAPGVDEEADRAWKKIKAKLMRGLSIGFKPLEATFDKTIDAVRITRSLWRELSVVTLPANAEATITLIRSIDRRMLAASGKEAVAIPVTSSAGVSAPSKPKAMKRTIKEQIQDYSTQRDGLLARATALMEEASTKGETLSDEQSTEHDNAIAEAEKILKHIDRLRMQEERNIATATVVTAQNTSTPETAVATRSSNGGRIQVRPNVEPGVRFARYCMAMLASKGVRSDAADYAKRNWPSTPEIEGIIRNDIFGQLYANPFQYRALVDAGDTTTSGWASQLVPAAQQLAGEFIDLLRPATIIGRIPMLRQVPFNVAVPLQSGGGTYYWVGENQNKRVTKPTYGSATLRWAKAAGIIVITEELARFSSPSAETLVRNELLNGLTQYLDARFISNDAAVSNVSPAGILNGISAVAASGTSISSFRIDLNNVLNNFTANYQNVGTITAIMSATLAVALGQMQNSLGLPAFPDFRFNGTTATGFPGIPGPVVISEAAGTNIIFVQPNDILIAGPEGVQIDVSREASVEMSDAPVAGEQSPVTVLDAAPQSLWQRNLVGFRGEVFTDWKVSRTSAVEYISGAAYTPS